MRSRARLITEHLIREDVHIHVHAGSDGGVKVVPSDERPAAPAQPTPAHDDTTVLAAMHRPDLIVPGAKSYVLKVKRDELGRISEIYATKLPS
jgi:hypothetical protein